MCSARIKSVKTAQGKGDKDEIDEGGERVPHLWMRKEIICTLSQPARAIIRAGCSSWSLVRFVSSLPRRVVACPYRFLDGASNFHLRRYTWHGYVYANQVASSRSSWFYSCNKRSAARKAMVDDHYTHRITRSTIDYTYIRWDETADDGESRRDTRRMSKWMRRLIMTEMACLWKTVVMLLQMTRVTRYHFGFR